MSNVVSERPLSKPCPRCQATSLYRIEKGSGEWIQIETTSGVETLEATVKIRECRDCGWRGSA